MFQLSVAQIVIYLTCSLADCSLAGPVSGTLLPPLGGQRYCNAVSASCVSFSAEAGGTLHLKWLHQGWQTAAFKHFLSASAANIWKPVELTVVRAAVLHVFFFFFLKCKLSSLFQLFSSSFPFLFFFIFRDGCIYLCCYDSISSQIFSGTV